MMNILVTLTILSGHQSPYFNIIEHLLRILVKQLRSRYTPTLSLQEQEVVLDGEWTKVPLKAIQTLYESTPRRVHAVISAKGGPAPN